MRRRQRFAHTNGEKLFGTQGDVATMTGLKCDWEITDSELAMQYEREFGKLPHHRMKRETIVDRLNDARNVSA